jgi:hypothetical protein
VLVFPGLNKVSTIFVLNFEYLGFEFVANLCLQVWDLASPQYIRNVVLGIWNL